MNEEREAAFLIFIMCNINFYLAPGTLLPCGEKGRGLGAYLCSAADEGCRLLLFVGGGKSGQHRATLRLTAGRLFEQSNG
ncbi:hypothetical protein BH10BAC3_BH10BAC3_43160 [soil metagenome]